MTDKLSIATDSKEIVSYFYEQAKKKPDGQFGRHIITAKKLLTEYNKDEIIHAIDHCIKHAPKGGVYSLGYIAYNIKEIITPIRKQKLIEQNRKDEANNKDIGTLPEPSDNSKKLKKFGNRKEFSWDD